MNEPLVTFGFVNCNRLYYLKSGVESLINSIRNYSNYEILIVDNASAEWGTDEYLSECKDRGFNVIKTNKREPKNEFPKALNTIFMRSKGDYICSMAADVQFVSVGDWLVDYVNFYESNKNDVGCILIDAQRNQRNKGYQYSKIVYDNFLFNYTRAPITPVCHSFISRANLKLLYPWCENNGSHEGGESAEFIMVQKIQKLSDNNFKCVSPIISPAITIYNESGDNAKIRGDRRYGNYFPPKAGNFKYYEIFDYDELKLNNKNMKIPYSIEKLAHPIGWYLPIKNGGFQKKSLNLDTEYFETVEVF